MKKNFSIHNPLSNSRGLMTAEFIFALTLVCGLCIALFALNFTLSMAEVAQYIAFSSSRAHAAAHLNPDHQAERARQKYTALKSNPVLASIFGATGANWFVLSENLDVRGAGPSGATFSEYPTGDNRVPQVGVRFDFAPRILTQRIAFLGSTTLEEGENLSAKITGLLIREPSQQECWELQMKEARRDAILKLDSRFAELGSARQSEYEPMEDNGC